MNSDKVQQSANADVVESSPTAVPAEASRSADTNTREQPPEPARGRGGSMVRRWKLEIARLNGTCVYTYADAVDRMEAGELKPTDVVVVNLAIFERLPFGMKLQILDEEGVL